MQAVLVMRTMQMFAGLVLAVAVLAGCSGNDSASSDSGASGAVPGSATTGDQIADASSADAVWANELVASAGRWQATTPRPVWTPANAAALCRPVRIPENPGPHGQYAYWVRVNPEAEPAFTALQIMPVGSVVVKEKHEGPIEAQNAPSPVALGVMIKREPGYDTQHGDWEYAYIDLDTQGNPTEVTRGKIATCIDCHTGRDRSDYLFRDYLQDAWP
ncbi:MAG: cytochrome P460 family protein [Phycisphaerales bacterium JB063]